MLLNLLFINLVSAFGIASDYYEGKPLVMAPGETKDIVFGKLQNIVSGRDMTMRAKIVGGEEIATLTDDSLDYFVPLGTKDTIVNMRVSIPKGAVEGEYKISVRFSEINPPKEKGTVTLGTSTTDTIKVLVQKPEKIGIGWILLVIVLVVVVIVVLYFIIKSKKGMSAETTKPPVKPSKPVK